MKILKLNKNKIHLENEEIIDISKDISMMFKLEVGMDISNIYTDIVYESMKNKAIYLISLKERTTFELTEKLKEKYEKHNYHLISDIVEYLKELNLIDDIEYAKRYINIYSSQGDNKIKNKLKIKGIKTEDILIAFEEMNEEINRDELQKLEILKIIDKNKNIGRDKIFRKLISKGYSYNIIIKTYRDYMEE